MDLLDLLFADLGDAVENKSCRDAVGNAVAEGHENASEERGNRLVKVIPLDFLKGRHHHHTDHNQGGRGGGEGHRTDKCGEERTDCKAQRNDNTGKTRASTGPDARRAFHIGGGVGGAEDSADGGCRRIGKQRLVHLGLEACAGFHCLLILIAENAAAAARADEGADGVEGIGKAEREDGDQYQRNFRGVCKQGEMCIRDSPAPA